MVNNREPLQRKPVGRATIVNRVFKLLSSDEHLMRLLHYGYTDKEGNHMDCLSSALPDIIGSPNHGKIAQTNVIKATQEDEIKTMKECMVFISQGKKRPVFGNKLLARQELIIDVLVHKDYQDYDYRLDDICDRLDYLIVHERIGMGETEIGISIPYEAPRGYQRYQLKYVYWDNKK